MAKEINLFVNTGKDETNQNIQLVKGKTTRVKAVKGARYQLQELNNKETGPEIIRSKRVGKNLNVMLNGGKEADLIIEGYYEDDMQQDGTGLFGRAENGQMYEYIPEDPTPAGLSANLTDGAEPVSQVLGGAAVGDAFILSGLPLVAAAGFGPLGLIAGAGLLVAAAAAGGTNNNTATTTITSALADASDTGAKGDNKTSDTTPTIVGKAPANSTVVVTLNGKSYTTTANANGDYTVTIPDADKLPDGTYTPKVTVTPPNGPATTTDGTPFTIDSSTNVLITNTGTPGTKHAISGTAEAGATVVLKDSTGKVIGTTTADANGKWSITPVADVPVGIITATATDAAGNTATDIAPTGALQADANNDSGDLGDNKTNVTSPTIAGKATPGSKVEVTINGKTYTTTADDNGDYKIPVTDKLPDGTYTPKIKITTPSGETNVQGKPFTVDTVTNVNIENPGSAGKTSPISGTAEPGDTVTVKDKDGNIIGTTTAGADGRWTVTPTTPVPAGPITATAKDAAGNTATGTADNSDSTSPGHVISNVMDDAAGKTGVVQQYTGAQNGDLSQGTTNDTTPTLNGTGKPGEVVSIYDNGTKIGEATVGADGKWTFTPSTPLSNGQHDFAIGKNTANAPDSGTYRINIDASKPATPVQDPTNNNNNTGSGKGNTFSVIDNVGASQGIVTGNPTIDDNTPVINGKGNPGDLVVIYDNGKVIGSTTVGSDGKWSFKPTAPLAEGAHSITTDVTNGAGVTSDKAEPVPFNIDTSKQPTSITSVYDDKADVVGQVQPNGSTNDSTPTISGKGTPGTEVTIKDGDKVLGKAKVGADGTWSFTPTEPLSDGNHNITASGTDNAGNPSTSGNFPINVDTSIPNDGKALDLAISTDANNDGFINFAEIGNNSGTPNNTLTVSAGFDKTKVAVGDIVTFTAGNGLVKTVILTQAMVNAGVATTTFASPGDGKTFSVKATLKDIAGNTTPEATDSAKLDLSNLSPQAPVLYDPVNNPTGKKAVTVEITTDTNNDGILNKAEVGSLTAATVKVTLASDAKAGDTLVITGTGNSTQTIVLTPAHISDGVVFTTFNLPANGNKLDVTAQIKDTAQNASNLAADNATVDTTPPGAPSVKIVTDTNSDGQLNRAELGTNNTVSVETKLPPTAKVGDVVTVTDGTTTKTHTLTQADLTAGKVTDTFAAPADGGTISVRANITSGGNTSADGTASAKIDTTNFADPANALKVNIDTDANNDGFINTAELGTSKQITATISLPAVAAVGDTVTIHASGNADRVITLTQAHINAGKIVITDFNSTADNTTFTVSASIKDAADNASPTPDVSDSATIKSTATGAPVVTISEDTNNDGVINKSELNGQVDITIALPSAAVAGDKLNVTINGVAQVITLTQAQIDAHVVALTTAAPAEGASITVTATLTDKANNTSPEGSDTARLVTISSNGGNALGLTIDTDADNDGYINFSEIGNTNGTPKTVLNVTATFDSSKVAVGDTITITANDGTVKTVILDATTKAAGKVTVAFASPGDGKTFSVKAILTDSVQNSTPEATDSASLDLSNLDPKAPVIQDPVNNPTGKKAVTVEITDDVNNDGILSIADINGGSKANIKVTLASDAKAGDTLVITGTGNATQSVLLTLDDITKGYVITTFNLPGNGNKLEVSAQITDVAKNKSNLATDSATVNTTPPGAPEVKVLEDKNNDGKLNKEELGADKKVTVETKLPPEAKEGDVVTVTDGKTTKTHTLTKDDIAAGKVTDTFDAPADGEKVDIKSNITSGGNTSPDGKITLQVDTTNFADPANALKVNIDTDANNDGFINTAELGTNKQITATVTLPKVAAVGDTVTIHASGNADRVITLTQAHITAGKIVITDFNSTADNTTFTVSASIKDAANNASPTPDVSDSADIKSASVSVKPTVVITEDTNNDGTIDASETKGDVDISITLPTGAAVGDKLIVTINGVAQTIVLKQSDIDAHAVALTTTAPADGTNITVTAVIKDLADNTSPEGSDTAKFDMTNMAPVVNPDTAAHSYTENGTGIAANSGITVSDPNTANLTGATVKISSGFTTGDVLAFTNANGITGSYNATTGVLTLTGNATQAQYQEALRSVTYSSTSDNPTATSATRTLSWQVDDGQTVNHASNIGTSTITVTGVNDQPASLAWLTYTGYEDAGAPVNGTTSGFLVSALTPLTGKDVDSANVGIAITGPLSSTWGTAYYSLDGGATWLDLTAAAANCSSTNALLLDSNARLWFAAKTNVNGTAANPLIRLWDGTDGAASGSYKDITGLDGASGAYSSGATSRLAFSVVNVNDAPTLQATITDSTFSKGGSSVKAFSAANATTGGFVNGTSYDQVNGVFDSIIQMKLTVGGLKDGADEKLTLDGSTFSLTNGATGTTATNGMTYTVSVVGGVATVTLSKAAGVVMADISTLVNNIAYSNTLATATLGDRVITITSLQDNGGVTHGGVDTASLSLSSTIHVTEPAPSFNSAAAVTIVENTPVSTTVYDADATYMGGSADTGITYTLSGTDAAKFTIDSATGAVKFITSPDYEAPTDNGTNNVYDITVRATATATGSYSDKAVTVTVTNGNDAPVPKSSLISTDPWGAASGGGLIDLGSTLTSNGTHSFAGNSVTMSGNSVDVVSGAYAGWTGLYLGKDTLGESAKLVFANSVNKIVIDIGALHYTAAAKEGLQIWINGSPLHMTSAMITAGSGYSISADGYTLYGSSTAASNNVAQLTIEGVGNISSIDLADVVIAGSPNGAICKVAVQNVVFTVPKTVEQIFGSTFTDPDNNGFKGVTITNAGSSANIAANGSYQYSKDGGVTWVNLAAGLSDTSAIYLAKTDLIRFAPTGSNTSTTKHDLVARLVDDSGVGGSSALTSGSTVDVSGALHGGSTAYSGYAVTVGKGAGNAAPVAANDTAKALEAGNIDGADALGNVISNDVDADMGDTISVKDIKAGSGAAQAVTAGTTSANGLSLAGSYGTIKIGADGSYVYTVDNANADVQALNDGQSKTDTFTYTVKDAAGLTSTATITVTVNGANDAPVAANIADTTQKVGTAFEYAVPAFTDVDNATLTYSFEVVDGTGATIATPSWMSFDAVNKKVIGSTASVAGTYHVKVTASDGSLTASDVFDVVVNNPVGVSITSASSNNATSLVESFDSQTGEIGVQATSRDAPLVHITYFINGVESVANLRFNDASVSGIGSGVSLTIGSKTTTTQAISQVRFDSKFGNFKAANFDYFDLQATWAGPYGNIKAATVYFYDSNGNLLDQKDLMATATPGTKQNFSWSNSNANAAYFVIEALHPENWIMDNMSFTPSTGSLTSNSTTPDATPDLSGTLTRALVGSETVHIFEGSTDLGQATVNGTSWSFSVPTRSCASHTFVAKVVDGANVVQSTSSGFTLNIAASPLVLDLNGDGVQTTSLSDGAMFDLLATGNKQQVAWVSKQDGLLALDLNGNGTIDSGAELFGNNTQLSNGAKAADGWSALAQYDSNGDGNIDQQDAVYSQLRVWQDANGNGATDAGELHSLADMHIASINLQHNQTSVTQNGNILKDFSTFTTTDGQTHEVVDAWLQVGTTPSNVYSLSNGESLDLSKLANVAQLKQIDLAADATANTIKLSLTDVLGTATTNGMHQLALTGDANDTAVFAANEWVDTGKAVTDNGHTYEVYSAANGAAAQLLIDQHMALAHIG